MDIADTSISGATDRGTAMGCARRRRVENAPGRPCESMGEPHWAPGPTGGQWGSQTLHTTEGAVRLSGALAGQTRGSACLSAEVASEKPQGPFSGPLPPTPRRRTHALTRTAPHEEIDSGHKHGTNLQCRVIPGKELKRVITLCIRRVV
jgi:hypothetical protein